MNSFWSGFEKAGTAKWQKVWSTLSETAKQRLRRAGGAGVKDVKAMREGMFASKAGPAEIARRNKLNAAIYSNALKADPDIVVRNSRAMPYAYKAPGEKGYMAMPKDPSSGNLTRAKSRPDISGAEGIHNRAMLEHERSELAVERMKAKRNEAGKAMRTNRAIQENADVVHSSAHPLIAEANIAGRSPQTLHDMRAGWSETPAQGQMYNVLKQTGWTPASGLPMYGRQAQAVQRKAEGIFAPHFKGMMERQIRRARGSGAKKQIVRESRAFAGGTK